MSALTDRLTLRHTRTGTATAFPVSTLGKSISTKGNAVAVPVLVWDRRAISGGADKESGAIPPFSHAGEGLPLHVR